MKNWHKITIVVSGIIIIVALGIIVNSLRTQEKEPEQVIKLDEVYAQLKAQETIFEKQIKEGNVIITEEGVYNLEDFNTMKIYRDPSKDVTNSYYIPDTPIRFEVYILNMDSNSEITSQTHLKWIEKDKLQVTIDEKSNVYNMEDWEFYSKTEEENGKNYVKNYLVHKTESKQVLLFTYLEELPLYKAVFPYPNVLMRVTESNTDNIKVCLLEGDIYAEKYTDKYDLEYLISVKGEQYPVGTRLKVLYKYVRSDLDIPEIVPVKIEKKYEGKIEVIFDPNENNEIEKIIKEEVKYPYNIYSYGGNVSVKLDGTIYTLEEALLTDKITMEEIIYDMTKNYEFDLMQDGGTRAWNLENFSLIKRHSIEGNRAVYFIKKVYNLLI